MAEAFAVELGMDEGGSEVIGRRLDPFDDEGVHHLGEMQGSQEQLGTKVEIFISVLLVLSAEDDVRLLEHHRPAILGNPHHLADDLERQAGCNLGNEVARPPLEEVINDLSGNPIDGLLKGTHPLRSETG